MTRKTTAKRREGGGYDFSFGTKSKKLLAVAEQVDGTWQITGGFAANLTSPFNKLRDLKIAWHALAEASYGQTAPPPTLGGPPSVRKGPPSLKPPKPEAPEDHGPRCPECKRPVTGWFDDMPPCRCGVSNDVDYTPDPFDVNMYDRAGGDTDLSMSGVLDMVYYWMMRNPEYVQTEGVMDSPWKQVQEVLWRIRRYAEYRPERFATLAEPGDPGLVTPAELGESIAEAERTLAKLGGEGGSGVGGGEDGEDGESGDQ